MAARCLPSVTHVAKDKGIPPFLLLYFSGSPDTHAQAQRLKEVLLNAQIPVRSYGRRDNNHSRLNDELGKPADLATQELFQFLEPLVGK